MANGKGLAVAGLVCGILSIVLAWVVGVVNIVAVILGIVGIILSVLGSKNLRTTGAPTGIATAGLVLSIIGTVLSAILLVACTVPVLCVANELGDAADELNDLLRGLD